jgi:uncharacterized protein YeaO (DUF488 family)
LFKIKRVYEPAETSDGKRILVDRLWPRGLSKARAHVDEWLREVSPSQELRKWFGHEPAKWAEFKRRYVAELIGKEEVLNRLRFEAKNGTVTLLYGARDEKHNQAVALLGLLED